MDHSIGNVYSSSERSYLSVSPSLMSILEDLWAILREGFTFILKQLSSLRQKLRPQLTFVRDKYHSFKTVLENFIYENPNASFFIGWAILVFSFKLEMRGGTHFSILPLVTAVVGVYLIYKPITYWATDFYTRDERADQTEAQTPTAVQDSFVPSSRYSFVLIDNPPRYESLPNLHPELFKSHSLPRYDEVIDQSEMPPRYSVIFSANNPDVSSIHQPRGSTGSGGQGSGAELQRARSLGDLPSASRPLGHT